MAFGRTLLSAVAFALNVPQDYFTPMFACPVDGIVVKYDDTFAYHRGERTSPKP